MTSRLHGTRTHEAQQNDLRMCFFCIEFFYVKYDTKNKIHLYICSVKLWLSWAKRKLHKFVDVVRNEMKMLPRNKLGRYRYSACGYTADLRAEFIPYKSVTAQPWMSHANVALSRTHGCSDKIILLKLFQNVY